jgi:hypothetical protein
MLSEQLLAMALFGDHAHPSQFVHGGNDEIPVGGAGTAPVAGPDLSAAGADIHAAVTGHYQALIEGHDTSISSHLIMFVGSKHTAASPDRHVDRRAHKSNHADYHH